MPTAFSATGNQEAPHSDSGLPDQSGVGQNLILALSMQLVVRFRDRVMDATQGPVLRGFTDVCCVGSSLITAVLSRSPGKVHPEFT